MTETIALTDVENLLKHREWLRRLAHHLVHDASVDDVVQDTCLRALGHGVPSDRPARPWLATVMRNVVRMNRRKSERRTRREQASATPPTTRSPEELVDRVRLERQLAHRVTELEEPYRSTLLLRYYEGMSSAEIGRAHGVPAPTVRWRLKQGLERLRTNLDADYHGQRSLWHAALLPIAIPESASAIAVGPAMVEVGAATKGVSAVGTLAAAGVATATVAAVWSLSTAPTVEDSTAPPPPVVLAAATADADSERDQDEARPTATPIVPPSKIRRIDPAARAELRSRILNGQRDQMGSPGRSLSTSKAGASRRYGTTHEDATPDEASTPSDGIDKEYIRQQMQELLPVFKECYQLSLAQHPGLKGEILLDFTIIGEPGIGGLVESCEYNRERSTIEDPDLIECVQESVYTLEFPAPENGGMITVAYPIAFDDRPE